jgi:hypothetical protein
VGGRAAVEREQQIDEGDEEQQVERALEPRLEDAVARGVEVQQGGRGAPRRDRPADRTGERPYFNQPFSR